MRCGLRRYECATAEARCGPQENLGDRQFLTGRASLISARPCVIVERPELRAKCRSFAPSSRSSSTRSPGANRRRRCHVRRFRPSPPRLRSRRRAWPRMPGTPATRPASRSPIPRTAAGATAPSSSRPPGIVAFLTRKWARELDYRLIKELWAFGDNRIAVRFAYEWHDDSGNWFRSYGNENWEFDARD